MSPHLLIHGQANTLERIRGTNLGAELLIETRPPITRQQCSATFDASPCGELSDSGFKPAEPGRMFVDHGFPAAARGRATTPEGPKTPS
jgi:hypothetical protein